MAKVEMYVQPFCGYCANAKKLLDGKGVSYTEYDVMADVAKRTEMIKRAEGRKTTPQIFIDDKPMGGFDDVAALDRAGKLDALLHA